MGDFEQFRLDRFAKLLGLPNACSSYEYLQAGERDGIRGWKKFVHIPDRSGAKAARRAAAARLRAELKRLQREQVLLLDEVQDKGANQLSGPEPVWANNPAKPEVLTVWSDPFDFTAADTEWWRCAPPEWKPQSIDLTTSPKADRAMFSRTGRWLVISNVDSERSVEIWDWPMRTKQSEFAFERYLSAIVFSPDESSLLAVYQNKLRSISLADGTSMGVRPLLCRDCRSLAVHPDGDWLALNYDGMLGLADVRAPDPVLLFGIWRPARLRPDDGADVQ